MAIVAVSFMMFMSVVFLFPTTPQTSVQDMNYSVVVLGGVLLLSLAWYYFPKYGGIHWFTGPIANVKDETPGTSEAEAELDDGKKATASVTVITTEH